MKYLLFICLLLLGCNKSITQKQLEDVGKCFCSSLDNVLISSYSEKRDEIDVICRTGKEIILREVSNIQLGTFLKDSK